jgi:hypothetical protein
VRTGGWGKRNFLFGGAFRFAKYGLQRQRKKRKRKKEGGAEFPQTPFLFALLRTPRRRRGWGGKAFPRFLCQEEGKTEKFSFP